MEKDEKKQWDEFCVKIQMLNQKCKNCRYGSGCANTPGNCSRHLPACLAFVPAARDEHLPVRRRSRIPLINRCKSFFGKIRQYLRKIGIVRCYDK